MARTGLFADLRLAMRMAAQARRDGAAPIDEVADPAFVRMERAKLSRRGLLTGIAGAGVAAAMPSVALARSDARIAVVGGGLAGLVAAHRLVKSGARNVVVYEANRRIGGRMLSGRDILAPGSIVELGGSFINTEHEDMLGLCTEFGLGLEDRAAGEDGRLGATYFIDGAHRTLTQEMGLQPDHMSALYLIDTFSPDPALPRRGLFHSDQRFQIAGGNDRLPNAIAAKVGSRIRTGHRLEALRRRGRRYVLGLATDGGARDVTADIVATTLPLTVLREMRIDAGLSPLAMRAIRETSFGTNAKLFAGGSTGVDFARGTPIERAREVTQRLDAALPGAAGAFTAKATRMHWPSNPFMRGSYSCFAPRQMTEFGDALEPVDGLIFAGEHMSEEHAGYMNGTAESGRIAAQTAAKLLVA